MAILNKRALAGVKNLGCNLPKNRGANPLFPNSSAPIILNSRPAFPLPVVKIVIFLVKKALPFIVTEINNFKD